MLSNIYDLVKWLEISRENERCLLVGNDILKSENAKLRAELEFEKSDNGWARDFLNRMAEHCGTKDCPSLVAYVDKLRELCNDMWSVMSCEYASDAMADACHDVLDCDMDDLEGRVNELCKEES